MSNYPTLPIVKDSSGFEYAEGYNLLHNGNFENGRSKWGNWGAPVTREIVTIENRKWLHVISTTGNYQGYNQYCTGRLGANISEIIGGKKLRISFICYVSSETLGKPGAAVGIHLNDSSGNIIAQKWITISANELSTTPKRYSMDAHIPNTADRFNIMVGKGNTPNAIEAWFTDIMVEYISDTIQPLSDYRPNPIDLIGGGLPMSIIARGLPLTVRNSIDEAIQNTASQLEQRLSTAITQTGESIENKVAQQYYAKGDTDRLIAEASTILEQKYNSFEMSFNSFKQVVNNNQNLTNAEFATITKFIRFIDGNIFLGEEGNNQMLKIAKDRISFLQGNQEVAYISDSTLYIYDGVFLNSLRIGDFAFVPRANGSMDLKKVR